jgi:hypothetical protein
MTRRAREIGDDYMAVWPLAGTILGLAGLAAGTVIARSRFDDPRLLHHGGVRLAAIGAIVVVLLIGLAALRGRLLLRLQLALMASLLAHLALMFFLQEQYLAFTSWGNLRQPLEWTDAAALTGRPTMPDYRFDDAGEVVSDSALAEPVEAAVVELPSAPSRAESGNALTVVAPPELTPLTNEAQQVSPPSAPPELAEAEPIDFARAESPARQLEALPDAEEAPIEAPTADELANQKVVAPRVDPQSLDARTVAPALPLAIRPVAGAEPMNAPGSAAPALTAPAMNGVESLTAPSDTARSAAQIPRAEIGKAAVETVLPVEAPELAEVVGGSAQNELAAGESGGTAARRTAPAVVLGGAEMGRDDRRGAPAGPASVIGDPLEVPEAPPVGGTGAAALLEPRRLATADMETESVPLVPEVAAPASVDFAQGDALKPGSASAADAGRSAPVAAIPQTLAPRMAEAARTPPSALVAPATAVSAPRASDLATAGPGRFVLEKSSAAGEVGLPEPVPAFRERLPQARPQAAAARGGSAASERAVEAGLQFLSRLQHGDGHWSLHEYPPRFRETADPQLGTIQADTAATGLSLLAYLGAGYTHRDGRYRSQVERGLQFLLSRQKADGDLFTGGSPAAWLYSHGIAAIALCEAFGMTRDPALREPARQALRFIVAAQHPTLGGWRYVPGRESDTSVSGWQMMALKSGELAGLPAEREAYRRVSRWLDVASTTPDTTARYAYMPSSRLSHQREATPAMTAEALLMRLYLGWRRDDPRLELGVDYLEEHAPQLRTEGVSARDAYYWYYATQVMFQVGGDRWHAWNGQLRDLLTSTQERGGPWAGSWHPRQPVADRWGLQAGRLYVTTMHLLMLEVYYRHLPLYQMAEAAARK